MRSPSAAGDRLRIRGALLVWAVGMLAYVVAVLQRSSLGVAGLEAGERFGISAATLSVLTVVQLGVYAVMQVPAGVLLDRFGSRALLVAGGVLMTAGQVALALAHAFPLAVAARVLVGLGDALTFISVLRLVVAWFPVRHTPLFVQMTGALGQLGSIGSAVPLVTLLHGPGWRTAFLSTAGLGVLAVVLVVLVLRDTPPGTVRARPAGTVRDVLDLLRRAWREPGTRLGLWTHFVTQFSGTVFLLLWGYPFLVSGQGLSPAAAGGLLSLLTVVSITSGPVLGHLVGSRPFHRSTLALGTVAATAAVWGVVLALPGRAPLWLLVVLVAAMAVSSPASMIGFDFARTANPDSRLGSATGIVNVGGFVASLVTVLAIGVVLDVVPGSRVPGGYSLDAFRWAFLVQYAVWALGTAQMVRYRRRVRRRLAETDPDRYAALRRGESVRIGD